MLTTVTNAHTCNALICVVYTALERVDTETPEGLDPRCDADSRAPVANDDDCELLL